MPKRCFRVKYLLHVKQDRWDSTEYCVIKAVIPRKLIVIRQLGAVTVAQGPVFIDIAKGVIHSHVAINRRANVAVSLHKPTILYKFVY